MSIPYRTQQNLRRLAIILLTLVVVGALGLGMWVLWLQRFVIYSRSEGAVLNFDLEQEFAPGEEAVAPEAENPVEIYYNEGEDKLETAEEITRLSGYYFEREQVYEKPEKVWEKIQTLPAGTAVLMDMKNIRGSFYYSTDTGRPVSDSADVEGVDQLISNLRDSDYYAIARVPALRDRAFGLKNTRYGLPVSGGYLWMDSEGCYWLNPAKEGTVSYLIEIAEELRDLGFDEVVFEDYYFPKTEKIVFKGDKPEALAKAAQTIVDTCATEEFTVSFVSDGAWTPPTGRSRVYRDDVTNPTKIPDMIQKLGLTDPATQLVFITSNTDTRYEEYGVLRPVELAMDIVE